MRDRGRRERGRGGRGGRERNTDNGPCEARSASEASAELQEVKTVEASPDAALEVCKATPAGERDDVDLARAASESNESVELIEEAASVNVEIGENMKASHTADGTDCVNDEDGHRLALELRLALDHTCDGDVEWRVAEICKNWEERQLSERGIGAESATALHLHQTMSSFQTRVLGELETIRAGVPAGSRDTGERFHAALLHAWEEVTCLENDHAESWLEIFLIRYR